MKVFRLPEYDPAAAHQQLHALFRLPAGLAPRFTQLLRQLSPVLELEYHPAQEALLAVFPEDGDWQGFLTDLGEILDGFAGSPGDGGVELLETRLAAPAAGGNPIHPPFSRFITLLNEEEEPPVSGLFLRLEYGTSFGSGQHPSTRLAMRALEQLLENRKPFPGRMLDVGCGSGILSLAASLFGARQVLGVDIDPGALALAGENAERNGLAARVSFSGRVVRELAGPYDLVVANLTGAVLGGMLADFERLVGRERGGWLIVSGLLGRQLEEICGSLAGRGFEVRRSYREGSWRAALLATAGCRP
jgi:ribosomal protein L11 methylase PrmA